MNTFPNKDKFENIAIQLSKVDFTISYEQKGNEIIGTIKKNSSFRGESLDLDKLKLSIENQLNPILEKGKTLRIQYA